MKTNIRNLEIKSYITQTHESIRNSSCTLTSSRVLHVKMVVFKIYTYRR